MALPSTGAISFLDIIEEIDGTRTPRAISLNDADVRSIAGIPSGAISFADLRGKSFAHRIIFSSNTRHTDVTSQIQNATRERVEIIINSGVVLYSGSPWQAALRINNLYGKEVTIINNGTIVGAGGSGGNGGSARSGAGIWADDGISGQPGTMAIYIKNASGNGSITLKNNGTIKAGGGGGGGGGGAGTYTSNHVSGGGGGGGGQGYNNAVGGNDGWLSADAGSSYEHAAQEGFDGSSSDGGNGGNGGQWTSGNRLVIGGNGGKGGLFGIDGSNGTNGHVAHVSSTAIGKGAWGGQSQDAINDPDSILITA